MAYQLFDHSLLRCLAGIRTNWDFIKLEHCKICGFTIGTKANLYEFNFWLMSFKSPDEKDYLAKLSMENFVFLFPLYSQWF